MRVAWSALAGNTTSTYWNEKILCYHCKKFILKDDKAKFLKTFYRPEELSSYVLPYFTMDYWFHDECLTFRWMITLKLNCFYFFPSLYSKPINKKI